MEGHVPRICLPQGDPQQYTATTYTEAMHCQGVFLPFWPLKAPGSTLGRVAEPLGNSLKPVPPNIWKRAWLQGVMPRTSSGQIVGERGRTAFPFRFWWGNAVPLAYTSNTTTATYDTNNRKKCALNAWFKVTQLSIGVTLNHAFCNL